MFKILFMPGSIIFAVLRMGQKLTFGSNKKTLNLLLRDLGFISVVKPFGNERPLWYF